MFKTVRAQVRARTKRKAIFELRAATIIKNNPELVMCWHSIQYPLPKVGAG